MGRSAQIFGEAGHCNTLLLANSIFSIYNYIIYISLTFISQASKTVFEARQGFDVDCRSSTGMTPLMEAARYGNVQGAALLLELKASPELRNLRGERALDIARARVPEHLDLQDGTAKPPR